MEIFEDAPDDNANWGEVVDTEKKFYNTSTSESSSGSSDENGKKENNLDVKPVRSLTLRWFSVTRFDYKELKSHMTCYKFKVSHWRKFYLSKKII